jgi:hypothetical protein
MYWGVDGFVHFTRDGMNVPFARATGDDEDGP